MNELPSSAWMESMRRQIRLREVVRVVRMVVESPPRSAQSVRLISKLKEKIEELDRI